MKFDAKMKRSITRDWKEQFPTFIVWKPDRLIKRYGPVLVGICFEPSGSNDDYTPIVHMHNLSIPFPTISLALAGRVLDDKGVIKRIDITDHEKKYMQFVDQIQLEYPYIDKDKIDFNDLVLATHKYLSGRYILHQTSPYNMIITTAVYLGQMEYAMEALNQFKEIISKWPDRAFNIIGSVDKWREGMLEMINKPDEICANVEEEIIKHKLTGIEDQSLLWPEKPLKLWEM